MRFHKSFLVIASVLAVFTLSSCSFSGSDNTSSAESEVSAISTVSTAQVPVTTQADTISYYFPRAGQDAEKALINVIGSARSNLDIAIYSITDTKIEDAVISDKAKGVNVRVITDKECSGNIYQAKVLKSFEKDGIPVKVNTHSGLMHLKCTIVDSSVATSGSYNYTAQAKNENDEVLIVMNNSKIAGDFEKQFVRMWNDTSGFKDYK